MIDISECRKMPNKSHQVAEAVSVTKLTHINDHTFSITVKIEDFKKKMKTWPPYKFFMSESFAVNNVPMRLKIYPNGAEDEVYPAFTKISDLSSSLSLSLFKKKPANVLYEYLVLFDCFDSRSLETR